MWSFEKYRLKSVQNLSGGPYVLGQDGNENTVIRVSWREIKRAEEYESAFEQNSLNSQSQTGEGHK